MHDALITLFFCHIPKEQRKTTTRITKQKQQEIYNKSQHYNLQSNALSRERLREIALCPVCDHLRQTQSRPAAYMSKLSKPCTVYICVYMYTCMYLIIWNKSANCWCMRVLCTYTNKRNSQNCPGHVQACIRTDVDVKTAPISLGNFFVPCPRSTGHPHPSTTDVYDVENFLRGPTPSVSCLIIILKIEALLWACEEFKSTLCC